MFTLSHNFSSNDGISLNLEKFEESASDNLLCYSTCDFDDDDVQAESEYLACINTDFIHSMAQDNSAQQVNDAQATMLEWQPLLDQATSQYAQDSALINHGDQGAQLDTLSSMCVPMNGSTTTSCPQTQDISVSVKELNNIIHEYCCKMKLLDEKIPLLTNHDAIDAAYLEAVINYINFGTYLKRLHALAPDSKNLQSLKYIDFLKNQYSKFFEFIWHRYLDY